MIKLYSIYDGWLLTEITPMVKQVQWSGSVSQPARKISFTMSYPLTDDNQPRVQIGPGTLISVIEDSANKEIFRGQVVDRTLNSSSQEETFTVLDYLRFFMKSTDSMNIKNTLPEDVAITCCSKFESMGITTGNIVKTGIPVNRVCPNKSYYNIMMECYTQASKQNTFQYIPIMRADKLNIIYKGSIVQKHTLQSLRNNPYNNNIIGMTYKDTLENMVNKVKIFDSEGNYIDSVYNADLINSYGLLQDTYQKENDKDPYTVAGNKLYGFNHEITIEAVGNSDCITGYAIEAKIWYLDVLQDTILYINEDTHTWNCGTGEYTMSLTVSLGNRMDLQGVD
jgi:hypothetical protein